jgi:hypothetical protein
MRKAQALELTCWRPRATQRLLVREASEDRKLGIGIAGRGRVARRHGAVDQCCIFTARQFARSTACSTTSP